MSTLLYLILLAASFKVTHGGFVGVKSAKTQWKAEKYCRETHGTHLASIHSNAENNAVVEACDSTGRDECWIGRYCPDSISNCDGMSWSKGWQWYDGTDTNYDDKFQSGSESKTNRGNVIQGSGHSANDGHWDDHNEDSAEYFVCSTTPQPTPRPTAKPTKKPTDKPTSSPTNNPSPSPTNVPTPAPTTNPTPSPTDTPSKSPTTLSPTNPGTLTCGSTESGTYGGKPITFPVQLNYFADVTFDGSKSNELFYISVMDSNNVQIGFVSNAQIITINDLMPGLYTFTIGTNGDWEVSIICVSDSPTSAPSQNPTLSPTYHPIDQPTENPTFDPSVYPTFNPSDYPTIGPSNDPTTEPTENPTIRPSVSPTFDPTNPPMPIIFVSNPTEKLSPNDKEVIDDDIEHTDDGNLNESDLQKNGIYEFIEQNLSVLIIGSLLLFGCIIFCILCLIKRKKKKYKMNDDKMDIEVTALSSNQIPTNTNGEMQSLQRIQSISSVDGEELFTEPTPQNNNNEVVITSSNDTNSGNALIDVLHEIGLYDALYTILDQNHLDLEMLENNLKEDEIEQLMEELELSMIQKIQFRKLMDAIKDNNMYKQKETAGDNNCAHSDSSEGDDEQMNEMYAATTKCTPSSGYLG